jgi:hypothetical protein
LTPCVTTAAIIYSLSKRWSVIFGLQSLASLDPVLSYLPRMFSSSVDNPVGGVMIASAASYGVAGCPRMKKEGQSRGKVGSGRNSSLYLCLMVAQLCRQSKSTYVPN